MRKLNLLYWIFTGLYAAVIILSSIPSLMKNPESIKLMVDQLGYPAYFIPYISVAKISGGIALLIPGYPRIKEWAYAGLFFDLISAVYSFIAINLPIAGWLPVILLFFVVLGLSYFFYQKRLKAASLNVK